MKIWLDDIREAPDGFAHCHSVNEAIAVIEKYEKTDIVELIDCDHDLGDYAGDGGDGIKLLDWLLERGTRYPIKLHTMNPVGRDNMQRMLDRYWGDTNQKTVKRFTQPEPISTETRTVPSSDYLLSASRFLCLVLRHKPEAAGITLDAHGWADVSELLHGIANRHPLTMEQLEEIVRTDDKQRYSFNEDKTKIRANQGHSVPVDVELEEKEPPEVLFHGTGEKYLDSILKNGLIPKTRLYVHLSSTVETAAKVGARHGTPVVLSVKSGEMYRDGFLFFLSKNGIWQTQCVPAEYLFFRYDN